MDLRVPSLSEDPPILSHLLKGKKAKLSLCLIKHFAMKAYGGVDV
jgi:hypothetical protein